MLWALSSCVFCFSTQLPQVMTICDCVSSFFVILPKNRCSNRDDTFLYGSSVTDGKDILPGISVTLFNRCGNLYCKLDEASSIRIFESHNENDWMQSLWVIMGMCAAIVRIDWLNTLLYTASWRTYCVGSMTNVQCSIIMWWTPTFLFLSPGIHTNMPSQIMKTFPSYNEGTKIPAL